MTVTDLTDYQRAVERQRTMALLGSGLGSLFGLSAQSVLAQQSAMAQFGSYTRSTVTPTYKFGKEPKMTKKRRIKTLEHQVKLLESTTRLLVRRVEVLERDSSIRVRPEEVMGRPEFYSLNQVTALLIEHLGLRIREAPAILERLELVPLDNTSSEAKKTKKKQ